MDSELEKARWRAYDASGKTGATMLIYKLHDGQYYVTTSVNLDARLVEVVTVVRTSIAEDGKSA